MPGAEETDTLSKSWAVWNVWCLINQDRGDFKKEQVAGAIKWRSQKVMENKDQQRALELIKSNIILDF